MALRVLKLHPDAHLPSRATAGSAGFDLNASHATVIPAGNWSIVLTGIAIELPPKTYGRIAPRSGIALKHGIDVGGGVIDRDYRGEIKIILFNHGKRDFPIQAGHRVAQLIIERAETPSVVVVESLDQTDRLGGFGSTGRASIN